MKNPIIFIIPLLALAGCSGGDAPLYKDPAQPAEKRAEDLTSRMTLEQKVPQMCQWVGLEHMKSAEKELTEEELHNNTARGFYPGITTADVEQMTRDGKIGSFLHVLTAEEANYLQRLASQSPLQIPLLIGIDAIHGNAQVAGCTVYPTSIGQASTFDPELVERICEETAAEMRATGSQWTFNPNVEVARDPRWGRVGETFGEDPYLVSVMGAASVRGYQGRDFSEPGRVLSCVKHFVGGSQPVNGTNGSPTDLSERTIREIFFPPFKAGIDAGAYSMMTAHNELNGIPCHSNRWLMEDVVRGEWGFEGFIVSDWMDVEHIHDLHRTATDNKDAFRQSVNAGMDMHMHGPQFYEKVIELVKEGAVSESAVNRACLKILTAKFKLGLFENPYTDTEQTSKSVFTEKHRATAYEAAVKSVVLLTNDGILPLDASKAMRVLVTGTNADNQTILGDWPCPARRERDDHSGRTRRAVAGLEIHLYRPRVEHPQNEPVQSGRSRLGRAEIGSGHRRNRRTFAAQQLGRQDLRRGLRPVGHRAGGTQPATRPAYYRNGNSHHRGVDQRPPTGRGMDRPTRRGADRGLGAGQLRRPGGSGDHLRQSESQRQAPRNHSPPRRTTTNGIQPQTVDVLPPLCHRRKHAAFPVRLRVELHPLRLLQPQAVSGQDSRRRQGHGERRREKLRRPGRGEIVQLYIRDLYSSVTRPVMELKDFRRVKLAKGETKTVDFTLQASKLAFYNNDMDWVVEAGDYKIMVGGSSLEKDLLNINLNIE